MQFCEGDFFVFFLEIADAAPAPALFRSKRVVSAKNDQVKTCHFPSKQGNFSLPHKSKEKLAKMAQSKCLESLDIKHS